MENLDTNNSLDSHLNFKFYVFVKIFVALKLSPDKVIESEPIYANVATIDEYMKTVDDANISEDSEHELLDEVDSGRPIRRAVFDEFIIFDGDCRWN